jgi:NAD(P)-dependent dehydrogenase (short-subunit alcohol dehydrogenase family)
LSQAAARLRKKPTPLGRTFRAYRCDFASREAVRHFAATVNTDFPAIDILVNNAGTILRKPAAEHPDEYCDEVIQTNLSSPGRDLAEAHLASWAEAGKTRRSPKTKVGFSDQKILIVSSVYFVIFVVAF